MTLRLDHLTLPMAALGDEGLPILGDGHTRWATPSELEMLGAESGRPFGARPPSLLPYREQNHYSRATPRTSTPVAVLQNERLRATFLLDHGGRLWSLYDLQERRELLFQPDSLQLANLALRNAWFSGGVEWNLGVTGHWPLTCEPVGAGVVTGQDGELILRLWAFERLLRLVWRVDFSLPHGRDRLYAHVRLHNPHDRDVPVYWWSNAAVPHTDDGRVLADAHAAFRFSYADAVSRIGFPEVDGRDASYPGKATQSVDYFFDTDPEPDGSSRRHPWVAAVDGSGVGVAQASTAEQHGKKLFIWGEGAGGHHWQSWLNGHGRYVEIQAGFARTQLEHIALAPAAEVGWVESWGPVRLPNAHAEWDSAVAEARSRVVDEAGFAQAQARFSAAATLVPDVLRPPDGWGAVEVAAGHQPSDPATPFAAVRLTAEQRAWLDVARGGAPTPELATSPQTGPEWRALLAERDESWVQQLLLGYAAWADGDRAAAGAAWSRSIELLDNPHAHRCLSFAAVEGWDRFDHAERAHQLDPTDPDLLVAYLVAARSAPWLVLQVVEGLSAALQALPRVRLAECHALIAQGRLPEARRMLDEPLVLPDLREGDADLSDLWHRYAAAASSDEPLPATYDFRMRPDPAAGR